jgi:hypothetical protein
VRTKPEKMPRDICCLDRALFFASPHPQDKARNLTASSHSAVLWKSLWPCWAPYRELHCGVGSAGYRPFLRETSWWRLLAERRWLLRGPGRSDLKTAANLVRLLSVKS